MIQRLLSKLGRYSYFFNPFVPWKSRICRKYGPGVERDFDLMVKTQWEPREALEIAANEKLRRLIEYVYEKVPYYRELMDSRGLVPSDFRSAVDLVKLPVLSRDDVRANREALKSREFSEDRAPVGRTGASTGEPLIFHRDNRSVDAGWGGFFRALFWTGFEWGDKTAYFWRTPDGLKGTGTWYQNALDRLMFSHVLKIRHYDAFRMNEEHFAGYAEDLLAWGPELIKGYPSALLYFADYCETAGVRGIRPKAVVTTAEPLSARERRKLETVFGCPVFDHYGFGEVYGVSFECEKHEGLHISLEHCTVEVLDETGARVADGTEGRLVVTDLDNRMMPFIRYECGDMGSLKIEPCSCGRALPLMDHVRGRIFGLIRGVNGNVVHGEYFADLLQDLGWYERFEVKQFEVVQRTPDGFSCSFVCGKTPGREAVESFLGACRAAFGDSKVEVEFVDSIPLTAAGKRRNTRSEIDPVRSGA